MDAIDFMGSLDEEQRTFFEKLIKQKESEFIQKSIELTLAKNRLRALNRTSTNYCIEYDNHGNEVDSSEYRQGLQERYAAIRKGIKP